MIAVPLLLALLLPLETPTSRVLDDGSRPIAVGPMAGSSFPADFGPSDRGANGVARPFTPTARNDARLRSVCFLTPERGWAVGDRGVIWHTRDGGAHWALVDSGVDAQLNDVFFLDDQLGWAVGGRTRPYSHTGEGVLLLTRDGGRSWRPLPKLVLPVLRGVRFFDPRQGMAFAAPSAWFPTGLLRTESGGLEWTPVGEGAAADWRAGDFIDAENGALASGGGHTGVIRRGGYQHVDPWVNLRSLRRMQLSAPASGWLVGDGGLVMHTTDLGASWQTPPSSLPEPMAREFDFRALCVRGDKIWLAGAPGTRVIHSGDGGRSWQSFPTGSFAPLDALSFADDKHGWAVGALGTILATDDGGQTWRAQRAGGRRAAVLGFFADIDDVPLELIARLAGNDGYLTVAEVLGRRDLEVPTTSEIAPADRVHEAVCAVGGCEGSVAWQFPLRQTGLPLSAEQIVALWNQASDGRGLVEFEARVCRSIRQWRPEIVVTHDASPRGDDPSGHLVNQLVLRAVESAADPTRFPDQVTQAGLEPWSVKKVFATLPPGAHAATNLDTTELAARLGRSISEVTVEPRGLIADHYQTAPALLSFRLLMNRMSQEQTQRDFFTGIVLRPGGDARRELLEPSTENLDSLSRLAQRRRNTQAILDRFEKGKQGGAALLGQTGELTRGLEPAVAGEILYQLADRYYHSGDWDLSAEAFGLLVDRYPQHALTPPALVWLVQYNAGTEAAWRISSSRRFGVTQTSTYSITPVQMQKRADKAAALGKVIERAFPELFAEPAVRFPLAAAHRQQGNAKQADRFYAMQGRSAQSEAWQACARGEAWLAQPTPQLPKPTLEVALAPAKPRLDGVLDDAVWQRAKPVALTSSLRDDQPWPAAVMLAYDAEHLYVGITCHRAPAAKYPAAEGPRPRDPDLAQSDRVELLIDLDRDYATYYRLSIDYRGWVSESCWGDASWNPIWYVATSGQGDVWTAEAAIPLSELTGDPPRSRSVWAGGVQRVVPEAGFQSWTAPAAVDIQPEGFGYLIFE